MKLVASPVVGFLGYFTLTHVWLMIVVGCATAAFEVKKWSRQANDMSMAARGGKVVTGIVIDVKNWVVQRGKDLQAMWIALQRFTPGDVMGHISAMSQKAAAMGAVAGAAASAAGGSKDDNKEYAPAPSRASGAASSNAPRDGRRAASSNAPRDGRRA